MHADRRFVVVFFVVFFAVAFLLQYLANAYHAELNVESDDPSHYVTGLMVHDYIADGFPGSPIAFAKNYYIHYPKVAIGHWPPVFYVMQALWMLPFGTSIHSDLVFMAFLNAMFATTLFWTVRRVFGSITAGAAVSLLLLCVPVLQRYSSTVMADLPVAVFCQFAILRWTRYLEKLNWKDAAWFAMFAVLAILTKGNGYALLLLPPFSILLGRRFELLRMKSLWFSCGVVVAICAPWSLVTHDLITSTLQMKLTPGFILKFFSYSIRQLIVSTSIGVSVFAFVGIISTARDIYFKRRENAIWLASLTWILAFFSFHALIPAGLESRYLLLILPAWMLLMARGIQQIARLISVSTLNRRYYAAAVAITAIFFTTAFHIPKRYSVGFRQVAEEVERPQFSKYVILVCSEADGEGSFISELAQLDNPRPKHVILRAGRVLADSDWNQRHYRLRYQTPAAVMNYLESIPVGLIVMDRTSYYHPNLHQPLLEETIRQYRQNWQLVSTYPAGKPPSHAIALYRLIGRNPVPQRPFLVDVNGTLHMQILVHP